MTYAIRRLLPFGMALILLVCIGSSALAAEGLPLTEEAYQTLQSIEKVDEDFYYVDYVGDYALDALMEVGAADEEALGAFISQQLLYKLPFHRKTLQLACSSFAAETTAGDYIQGRNMDYALAQNILVRTKPQNGYASLSMASGELLGYIDEVPDNLIGQLHILAAPYYALDGINEKGLSIAILLQTYAEHVCQETGKPPMTTTMAVRMVLDKAATVDEAIELMAKYDMRGMADTNFHFLIVDANGDKAVIEYVEHEMRVNRAKGYGLPVTNFFISEGVVEEIRDGEDRIIALQAALDEHKGVITEEIAWEMLDSVKAIHDYDEKNDIDYNTAYSMIFNNSKRSVDICINMHFDKVYSYQVEGAV